MIALTSIIKMGYIIIAPAGDNLKSLLYGLKEFPTDRVVLITPKQYSKAAHNMSKKLQELTIPVEIIDIKVNVLEEMFATFAKLLKIYSEDQIMVNVSTGDRISTCAALSASYANGLKAFGCESDGCMLMPIMKLSYYRELSDNKLSILKVLDENEWTSLKDLNKKLKMSTPLLSYHINGNRKYKGLKEFRLVVTDERSKQLYVKLSEMGKLLLRGYIPRPIKK